MSHTVVCRICLRTNISARDIPEVLVALHDEICDYDIYASKIMKYCSICKYQLEKFHNFRLRCNQANKILKTWKKKKLKDIPDNLYEDLPPSTIGTCTTKSRYKLYKFNSDLDHFDLRSDLRIDLLSDHEQIKTENEDTERVDYIFVTKDMNTTDSENPEDVDKIDFEQIQKREFLKKIEEVLQKNDLGDINSSLLQDDMPLNELKAEYEYNHSNYDFLNNVDDDDDDDNDVSYTVKEKKPKHKRKLKVKRKRKESSVKYEDVDDLSLAELIQNCGSDDKVVKTRQKFLKNKTRLKDRILELLDSGRFNDLGDGVKMNKDIFLKIFNRYDKCDMRMLTIKPDSPELAQKLKKFLLYLLKKYNPEYETIFDVEYLDTDEKKLQEFNRRKDGTAYMESAFKCELCYKGFEAQSHLDYHNKWHKPTANDIVCNICPMRFVSKSTYKAHRKNNHTVVYSCKQCPVVTYHFSVMINHYNQHKGVEYHCPTCLSVYTNKTTLNNHRREAHATSHICTSCARSFVSEKGLFFHRKYKHKDDVESRPEERATCLACNITFDSHKVYLKHEKSMHTRRPETVYKCYFCKDGFDSIEALRKHKLELNHQRAPKQVIHRTSIGAARGAKRTRRTRVSDPDKPYRNCPVCGVEVPNAFPTSLYMHYLEAHPEVPYNSVYTDSKDYLCEQCGKTFRVYCHYLDHKNQHTGAKPYACKECPSRFATRKHLVYHSERHRPPRYQCKQCGKLFLSAANLFAHRRGHIGDRRFKCEICFKGFLHSYTLKEHIKGVHNQIRRVRKVPSRDKSLM